MAPALMWYLLASILHGLHPVHFINSSLFKEQNSNPLAKSHSLSFRILATHLTISSLPSSLKVPYTVLFMSLSISDELSLLHAVDSAFFFFFCLECPFLYLKIHFTLSPFKIYFQFHSIKFFPAFCFQQK